MINHRQLKQYRRDGVVCVRRAFDANWIALAKAGIERGLANPGPFFRDHTGRDSPGRYLFDFWNWRSIPEFEQLMFAPPLAELGATVLNSRGVRMLMDNWFVREAGSVDGAPWHHDEPYLDFEGRMCIVWIPLEGVRAEHGLTFVQGSHAWGQLYVAEQFSDNVPFKCDGGAYQAMPDFDGDSRRYRFLSWDLQPGDCLVFDFRTIHRSSDRHRSADRTTHRMTFRMGDDDVVFRPRGQWTRQISEYLIDLGQGPGKTLDNPLTPLISAREPALSSADRR